MTLPVLMECSEEILRLAAAGAHLAKDDFGLKRLIEPLNQYGSTAPILNEIAKRIQSLIDSNDKSSAENFLNLAALLNGVIKVQAQTQIKGKLCELNSLNMEVDIKKKIKSLPISARLMKSIFDALTSTGSGRFEIIQQAGEQGYLNDIRLIHAAVNALDDRYSEIADYMAEKALPAYGPGVLPLLRESLDIKGGRGHGRRLKAIFKICREDGWDLYLNALKNGSKDVKIAAINSLAQCKEKSKESILIEQTKAKNKEVRQKALKTIGKWETDETAEALIEALDGKDAELAVFPSRANHHPRLLNYLINQADELCLNALKSAPADVQMARLMQIFSCFYTKNDSKTQTFLMRWFARKDELIKIKSTKSSGKDLVLLLADLLEKIDTPQACDALVENHEQLNAELLGYAFGAAIRHKDPAWVYDQFSPYLIGRFNLKNLLTGKKAKKPVKAKIQKIAGLLKNKFGTAPLSNLRPKSKKILDPRWLDAAMQAKNVSLICYLIRPDHLKASEYLAKCWRDNLQDIDLHELLWGIIQAKHPQAVSMLLKSIEEKLNQPRYYNWYYLICLIEFLPIKALPQIKEFRKKMPEKFFGELSEAIRDLKKRHA